MLERTQRPPRPAKIFGDVHDERRHDSAHLHVSGQAQYVDDLPEPAGCAHLYVAMSERAHAEVETLDLSAVETAPGVLCVLSAEDIPGENDIGPVIHDDPVFAEKTVKFHGQPIFAVAATSRKAARLAATRAAVSYVDKPALLTLSEARAQNETVETPQVMRLGDAHAALAAAPKNLTGTLQMGGQDHFYLEGQIAMAVPGEDGAVKIYSSTQNPTEAQHLIAHLLHKPSAAVTGEVRRMGGAFGGKGEVRVKSFCAVADDIAAYGPLETEDGARSFDVSLTGVLKNGLAAKLSGVTSKEAAAALKGVRFVPVRCLRYSRQHKKLQQ